MSYRDITDCLTRSPLLATKGPVGMIFVEDLIEVESTIRHHLGLKFAKLIVFAPPELRLAADLEEAVMRIDFNFTDTTAESQINQLIQALPGIWLYYCYNAEYLYFPFCETRSVRDVTTFIQEERRDATISFVIDLYAGDLSRDEAAVNISDAYLDKSGYYALARDGDNGPKERQLDFFGGLRWRFEEHIPRKKRRIDRIAIFRASEELKLLPGHIFNQEEYNTYSCPWHNNLTTTICSFRTAKALKTNPGSTFDIHTFQWYNSQKFEWHSQQLMDLGLMEPGQWF